MEVTVKGKTEWLGIYCLFPSFFHSFNTINLTLFVYVYFYGIISQGQ